MITKAVVEEVISPYQVKLRIPIFDRASSDALSTKADDLHKATICALPNCYINLQVGDIVFVGFEDNTTDKAVILGHLCKEAASSTYADVAFRSVVAKDAASLPKETCIGDVSSHDLYCLLGARDNLQKQIDAIDKIQKILYAAVFPSEELNT